MQDISQHKMVRAIEPIDDKQLKQLTDSIMVTIYNIRNPTLADILFETLLDIYYYLLCKMKILKELHFL